MLPSARTIDEHIARWPKKTQALLRSLRALIRAAAPEAVETISYGIPTFDFYGHLIHFAGYPQHIGLYPGPKAIRAFRRELAAYPTSRGAIQFPLDRPLPRALLTRLVTFCVQENLRRAGRLFPKTSAPAQRALEAAGIETLKDLSKWTETRLLTLHGLGPASLPILRKALKEQGLRFKAKTSAGKKKKA